MKIKKILQSSIYHSVVLKFSIQIYFITTLTVSYESKSSYYVSKQTSFLSLDGEWCSEKRNFEKSTTWDQQFIKSFFNVTYEANEKIDKNALHYKWFIIFITN